MHPAVVQELTKTLTVYGRVAEVQLTNDGEAVNAVTLEWTPETLKGFARLRTIPTGMGSKSKVVANVKRHLDLLDEVKEPFFQIGSQIHLFWVHGCTGEPGIGSFIRVTFKACASCTMEVSGRESLGSHTSPMTYSMDVISEVEIKTAA